MNAAEPLLLVEIFVYHASGIAALARAVLAFSVRSCWLSPLPRFARMASQRSSYGILLGELLALESEFLLALVLAGLASPGGNVWRAALWLPLL